MKTVGYVVSGAWKHDNGTIGAAMPMSINRDRTFSRMRTRLFFGGFFTIFSSRSVAEEAIERTIHSRAQDPIQDQHEIVFEIIKVGRA